MSSYFIKPIDNLSQIINDKAKELFDKLEKMPVEKLPIPDVVRSYFTNHHSKRGFFSVQTAAELLYRSIKLKGKEITEITIMDYGAGVGSLYLLAKMIGCKKVIYNDIVADMTNAARSIADYLNIDIDIYITNDFGRTVDYLNEINVKCDIILSRNVVEHIYDLNSFYQVMSVGQPDALIYFSTTANYHNPAMLWYHKKYHKKYEAIFCARRKEIIEEKLTGIAAGESSKLAFATRGLAMKELENAIVAYQINGTMPNPSIHYTNTCDPDSGLWYEHIIPVKEYQQIIESKGYKLTILPAFWDTHYSSSIKNMVGKTMNFITNLLGPKAGLTTTAFIYVIAEKKL